MNSLNQFTLVDGFFEHPNQQIYYRLFHNATLPKRQLLLLHGAGVDGLLTWQLIAKYLTQWSDVLVPDLRGAGKTIFPDKQEHDFTSEDIVNDIIHLLSHLHWQTVDLAGYSFGGLISMLLKQHIPEIIQKQILIESALVYGISREELIQARNNYKKIVPLLLNATTVDQGIHLFMDLVSPNRVRTPKSDALLLKRLTNRPIGFAHAIECVNRAALEIDRDYLLQAQEHVSSYVGDRSEKALHEINKQLASSRSDWEYHIISRADHALVFQKPRVIAQQINMDMQAFLNQVSP